MKLGVIADDFTGASDIALTLSEGGMRVAQFVGLPRGNAPEGIEAAVIALKSRTSPVGQAVKASLAACDWLRDAGAEQIVFKVCSTFDSTDEGNIGPVTAALAERLGEAHVLVCPAFPENGRSVYMGHLFVGDRLLNESGMENHPLTPMRDADLRRVLARQTDWPVRHLPIGTVREGAGAVAKALTDEKAMFIADAIEDADLLALDQAVRDRKLITGGSGIALGLPANFGCMPGKVEWDGTTGPGLVLSGSCSRATRAQVQDYAAKAPAKEVSAEDVLSGRQTALSLADWAMAQDVAPLIYTSADPEVVARAQQDHGAERVATAIEACFADLAATLAGRGVTRIVVAGGETSGAVVNGLGADVLEIGPRLAAGVPALKVRGRNLALALKSGNFGDKGFFATALTKLEGAA